MEIYASLSYGIDVWLHEIYVNVSTYYCSTSATHFFVKMMFCSCRCLPKQYDTVVSRSTKVRLFYNGELPRSCALRAQRTSGQLKTRIHLRSYLIPRHHRSSYHTWVVSFTETESINIPSSAFTNHSMLTLLFHPGTGTRDNCHGNHVSCIG